MAVREQFEVVIVGGGPAGLCAALYGGRGMLRTVLLERGVPGGELLNTEWIEDYPGFPKVKGRELAALMTQHALQFGAEIRQENAESIVRRADGMFEVTTSLGTIFEAPAVIITAGGTPLKLEVPGELEYAGRGVSYCAVCDGAFFKGDTIAVASFAPRRSCRSGSSRTRRSRFSGTSACWSCSATRRASRPSRSRTRSRASSLS